MKKFNISLTRNFLSIVSLLMMLCFVSCNNDDNSSSTEPTITSVNRALNIASDGSKEIDVPTEIGYPNNTYFIKGKGFSSLEKIYFNDFESYFNPTMVTDSVIVITIDIDTPYENVSNELKIVTKNGTATYPFVIGPPAPILTKGFNPVNAQEGDEITIYGNYFLDPVVKVGETTVPIITSSLTEIKIKAPAGADKKYISVTNITGTATSTYAIGTAIYDDKFYDGWTFNDVTYLSDGKAQQGLTYFKKAIGAWSGMESNWSWYSNISDYSGLRFSVRAEQPGGRLVLIFNGDWGNYRQINVTTEWQEFFIPWSDLNNADHVQVMHFRNDSDTANVYYFDNIGYKLK